MGFKDRLKQKKEELLQRAIKNKIKSMQEKDQKRREKIKKSEKGTISYGLFTKQPVKDFIRDNIERRRKKREERK